MKLTILSDVHLEFMQNFWSIISRLRAFHSQTDLCILAGDIGHYNELIYSDFLGEIRNIFPHVIVIPGNHEYHPREKMNLIDEKLRNICQKNNCIFLNKSCVQINNIKFVGSTLWTNCGNVCEYTKLGDQMYSNKLLGNLHYDHLRWLTQELAKNEKSVVITHHCPSFQLRAAHYPLDERTKFFYSHLDYLIKDPVKLWVCGHSHHPCQIRINGVPVVMNPVGYVQERGMWSSELIINV